MCHALLVTTKGQTKLISHHERDAFGLAPCVEHEASREPVTPGTVECAAHSGNPHLRNEQEGLERGLAEAKGVAGVLGTCGRVRWARRNAVFLCPTFCGMALAAKLAGKKPGQ